MAKHAANTFSLVADIGGTNTRVALAEGARVLEDTVRKYPNSEFPGLETVLRQYIADEDNVDCAGACVAVAGPVRDGVGELTNLDWSFDKDTLFRATKAEKVAVLNDLQAQGHALPFITEDKFNHVIKSAEPPNRHAARLVIGIGTGFNAAPVFNTEKGVLVPPSESGHANLPIRTEDDLRLLRYVETAHGFPAVEDVLSGRGLQRVYAWLASETGAPAEKSSAEIMTAVAAGTDELADEAVRTFIRILGTVAGNLTLIQLPFGGVYLIGGMARAMAPYFDRFGFAAAYRDKGRFAGFMNNFSVSVVEDDYAALIGCASHLNAL